KKLKIGMAMKKDEAADGANKGSGSGSASGSASDKADDTGKKAADKKSKKGAKNPLRIAGYWGRPVLTPASYNKLAYVAPDSAAPTTLWAADKVVGTAVFGANLEVAIPVKSFAVVPGVRYRTYTPTLIESDYNKGRLNPYVSTEQSASALGAWIDFQYQRIAV